MTEHPITLDSDTGTDTATDAVIARRERLAALTARRPATSPATARTPPAATRDNSAATLAAPSHTAPSHTAPSGRPRRTHAAAGGRILAAGLSVSAAIAFTAAMADAARSSPVATPVAPVATASPIVIHVVLPDGRITDTQLTPPPVAAVAARARTTATTRAS